MADDATLEESVGKMTELITDLKGCLEKFKDKPKLVSCGVCVSKHRSHEAFPQ